MILALTGFLAVALVTGIAGAAGAGTEGEADVPSDRPGLAVATLSSGCFWCTESDFEKVPGVVEVISGYAGGREPNPSYQDVGSGRTGHVEAVQILYDPKLVSYSGLLDYHWRHHDPTDPGGQFVDRGKQYRAVIFYHNEAQRRIAEAGKEELAKSGRFDKPIVTEIVPFTTFYNAEDYHQDYHKRHSLKYRFYRYNSGRDQFLEKVWGKDMDKTSGVGSKSKPSEEELKKRLTPLQYKVTQEEGTEPPFKNELWDNKREGIYVDIVSGEVLFSSKDKYESGTGWPSFTKPLEPDNITTREDNSLFSSRTEVRSREADSHLGHVFPDGPPPTGLRYCMNSAAMRFIPKEELEQAGYGQYRKLFE